MTGVVTELYSPKVSKTADDGIAERVRWLVDNRADGNARELARRAKLASETHVGLILERGGDRTAGTILAKIADAGAVNLRWLITGEGPRDLAPEPTTTRYEGPPRYRNRSIALEALREEIHPETAARVEREAGMIFNAHVDPTVSDWMQAILIMDRKVRLDFSSPEAAEQERERDRAETERLRQANALGRAILKNAGVDTPSADELPPPPPKERKKR